MASGSASLAKFILCLWNLFFIALSVCFILVGSRKFMVPHEPANVGDNFLGIPWDTLSIWLIVTGVIMAVTALTGFNAAVCESPFLLKSYVTLLVLGCVAVVGATIASWMLGDLVTKEARNYFGKLMVNSSQDSADVASVVAVNKWQETAMCCGKFAPSDWHNLTMFDSKANFTPHGYPSSCCGKSVTPDSSDGSTCPRDELLYHEGCFSEVLLQWYKRAGLNLMLVTLSVFLFLLILSCCLERDHQLANSKLINLEYASHLKSCMGSGRAAASYDWPYAFGQRCA